MKVLNRRLIIYCAMIVLTISAAKVSAQESMMTEISYPYLDKLVDTALKYYPRVKMYEHRVLSQKENIAKAKASWFDLFTFSYLYSPNNSTTLVNPSILNGYQFGIFFNVSQVLQKPHQVKQAKEDYLVTKFEGETNTLNVIAEVKVRYFRYISQITMLKQRSLSAIDAENMVKQSRISFEKSEIPFENYNRSLTVYSDRKQGVIQAEADMLIAKAYLEEMIGKKLEEIN